MFYVKSKSISLEVVKLNPEWPDIICNKWPLDGSHKTLHETVAWRTGTLYYCLAYPGRACVLRFNILSKKRVFTE